MSTPAGSIDVSLLRLAAGYVFVLLALAIAARRKVSRSSEILIGSLRMTVQLVAVGYLLEFVFEYPHPAITVAVIAAMQTFAVRNVYGRVKRRGPAALGRVVWIALCTGTALAICYFLFVILALRPWYEPRYAIPIAGMLIGNSMTGISLAYDRLVAGFEDRTAAIDAALMLGATPAAASRGCVRDAFAAAILPTVNAMMGMGIVFLPGMMTGQILGGASPVLAIRYQIAIMLGIVGSVTVTTVLLTSFGWRAFFDTDKRLIHAR